MSETNERIERMATDLFSARDFTKKFGIKVNQVVPTITGMHSDIKNPLTDFVFSDIPFGIMGMSARAAEMEYDRSDESYNFVKDRIKQNTINTAKDVMTTRNTISMRAILLVFFEEAYALIKKYAKKAERLWNFENETHHICRTVNWHAHNGWYVNNEVTDKLCIFDLQLNTVNACMIEIYDLFDRYVVEQLYANASDLKDITELHADILEASREIFMKLRVDIMMTLTNNATAQVITNGLLTGVIQDLTGDMDFSINEEPKRKRRLPHLECTEDGSECG